MSPTRRGVALASLAQRLIDPSMTESLSPQTPRPRLIAGWLFGLCALIALMVTVGGATRLTDSGLSITEWDPIMGALPPLSEAGWQDLFEKYKQIPEYTLVNAGMTLAQFEEIFWWEWGHRNLGRFIGLYVALPLLWWSLRGTVSGPLRWRLWGLFALVGLQGAIGWFMVASGLSDRVDVSHFRLALHLATAFLLFGLTLLQALSLWGALQPIAAPRPVRVGLSVLMGGVFLQIIFGAFVAGLRAGKTYNTWPLMDGEVFPRGYFVGSPDFGDTVNSIAAVQFNHRLLAYVLTGVAIWLLVAVWREHSSLRRWSALILAGIVLQMGLGIWTVVMAVPMALGLLHQLAALCLFGLVLTAWYRVNPAWAGRDRAPQSSPVPTSPTMSTAA